VTFFKIVVVVEAWRHHVEVSVPSSLKLLSQVSFELIFRFRRSDGPDGGRGRIAPDVFVVGHLVGDRTAVVRADVFNGKSKKKIFR